MEEVKALKLGDEVIDTIVGFKGIVVSITTRLTGCTRIGVQGARLVKAIPVELQWFDEERLELFVRPENEA